MEFIVDNLDQEELLIEFEIRKLADRASQESTQTMKEALVRMMEDEREDSFLVPKRAHEAAQKQPRREIIACVRKLNQLRNDVVNNVIKREPPEKWLPGAWAKLAHLQGRANRVSQSTKFHAMSAGLRSALEDCGRIVSEVKRGTQTLEQARAALEVLVIEVPGDEVPEASEKTSAPFSEAQEGAGPSNTKLQPGCSDEAKKRPVTFTDEVPGEFQRKLDQIQFHWNKDSTANDFEQPRDKHLDSSHVGGDRGWNNAKLRQEASTWKVYFRGLNSDLTIQRFLTRIEWRAMCSNVPQNLLVKVLDLCLEGEAYKWFWSIVDRNPAVTWDELKQEMSVCFSTITTVEDVERMLNNRRQQYPKETMQEYYQAMQEISLKSEKNISEATLYSIIRRNMRPGLQLALYEEQNFKSLPDFIRRCTALETLWRRFGKNPERNLAPVFWNHSNEDRDRAAPRRQVTFDSRRPQVHELEMEGCSIYEQDQTTSPLFPLQGEVEGNEPQVSAFQQKAFVPQSGARGSNESARPGPDQREPAMITSIRPRGCWNCGQDNHMFMECRRPINTPFCFKCGFKGTYTLDCKRCHPPENWRAEMKATRELHFDRQNQNPRGMRNGTEDAASNTDPELYRRR